ncbi:MAG: hypothetical protein IKS13_03050 [Ruminococcus sp.]|nr:hypothetical protein [Ruminococcus sp.]
MIDIYKASVQNVAELKKRAKNVKRLINAELKSGNCYEVETLTKVYALMYSAFAETAFLKMINTPYGFDDNQINQVLKCRNLEEKWKKCMEFALSSLDKDGETANKKKKLLNILDEYIIKPSKIRNKVAHGQWKECLNNDCTHVNNELTTQMQALDYSQISRLFEVYERFSQIVEDLIESPDKTHYRDYYLRLVDLEAYIKKTSGYCIEDKKIILKNNKPKNN